METLGTLPSCAGSLQSGFVVFAALAMSCAADARPHTAQTLWCSGDRQEHLGGQHCPAAPQQGASVTPFQQRGQDKQPQADR